MPRHPRACPTDGACLRRKDQSGGREEAAPGVERRAKAAGGASTLSYHSQVQHRGQPWVLPCRSVSILHPLCVHDFQRDSFPCGLQIHANLSRGCDICASHSTQTAMTKNKGDYPTQKA